jgi:hypothetical protein
MKHGSTILKYGSDASVVEADDITSRRDFLPDINKNSSSNILAQTCLDFSISDIRISAWHGIKLSILYHQACSKGALQSDLHMCTKEPTFYDTNSLTMFWVLAKPDCCFLIIYYTLEA